MKNIHGLKIIFFLLLISTNLFCQWVQTKGPYGGTVNCLTAGSNGKGGVNIYAGAERGGIFISADTGKSWTYTAIESSAKEVFTLAAKDSTILAAANINGCYCAVFLSADYGKNWTESGLKGHYTSSFAFSGSNIIAGTWDGIFISADNGAHWTHSGSGMPNYRVLCLASSKDSVLAGTENGGVFLSKDNGSSFKQINTGLSGNDINALILRDTIIYAGADHGYVFLSTNKGIDWTALNIGTKSADVTSLALRDSSIFAGTYLGVFMSNDNGNSWKEVNNGFTIPWEYNYVRTLVVAGTNIFAASGNGIFLSTNNGTIWTPANAGLTNTRITSLAVTGYGIFAGTQGCGIFFSADSGQSWKEMNKGLVNPYILSLAWKGSKIGAATYGGLYLSTDNGNLWTDMNSGLFTLSPDSSAFPAVALSDSLIFAGSIENGVFISTDNGLSWKAVSNGLSGNARKIRTLTLKGSNLFAGTEDGIYLSTDNASSWKPVNNGLLLSSGIKPQINTLVISGNNIFAGVSEGIFLSTDNGAGWKAINNGLAIDSLGIIPGVISIAAGDSNIFAGTDAYGVFQSKDSGAVWMKANEGFPESLHYMAVPALAISGKNAFAALGNLGVWTRPLTEVKAFAKHLSGEISPMKFTLEQNYPNPFNPSTAIRFSIAKSSYVNLRIYNSLGQMVTELISRIMAPGQYTAGWNAGANSSGVYFYQIKAGNFIGTRKMILLR